MASSEASWSKSTVFSKEENLFVWFFVSQPTIFQLCRDRPSCFEPVLSKEKCVLLNDTQHSEAGEACGPSVSNQALYNWATVLPVCISIRVENSVNPAKMASWEASWSGSSVFTKEDKPRFSRTEVENTICLGRMWSCTSLAFLNRKATLQSKEEGRDQKMI